MSVVTGGSQKKAGVDPVELQQTLLRFADEFSAGTIVGLDKLRRGTNGSDPAEILQAKIALLTETCGIVSGPNPLANLFDMTVFVTVARSTVEEHWLPNEFGESAQPLVANCRKFETNIWRITDKVLTPEQRTELSAAIETWRRDNPAPEGVLGVRAVGFASQAIPAGKPGPDKPGSVFNLLMLDPLAGMEPAVREIAQSRLFAERALYVTQKMPMLLRWQTELLSMNALRLPAVQQVITNSTQVASSVDSFARLADQFPQLINEERQAAIQQVFDGLAAERTNWMASLAADEVKLHKTLAELRQTLEAGTELVKSSEATLQTLDAFLRQFDSDTNAPAPSTAETRPFDILDYAATARDVTTTLKELNATVTSLDQAMPQIRKAGDAFETAGDRLLNRFFLIGAALIGLLLAGSVFAALIYRRFVNKSIATTGAARVDISDRIA